MSARVLWHFTCEHGFAGLGAYGRLGLNPHPLLPRLGNIAWLTDDPQPERDAVGLTSSLLMCDRMAYRYRVSQPSLCIPWGAVRHLADEWVLTDLESFGKPESWWITRQPLYVKLDRSPRTVMREAVSPSTRADG